MRGWCCAWAIPAPSGGAFDRYEDTYPARLQSILEKTGPYYVVNLGVPGYSILQGYRLFEQVAAERSAKWVILYFGWDDCASSAGASDSERDMLAARIYQTLSASRMYLFLNRIAGKDRRQIDGRQSRLVPLSQFVTLIEAFKQRAEQIGARALLLTGPYATCDTPTCAWLFPYKRHRIYNEALRIIAGRQDMDLVDLERAFEQLGVFQLFEVQVGEVDGRLQALGGDPIHPNELGHALIAELAAEVILARDSAVSAAVHQHSPWSP